MLLFHDSGRQNGHRGRASFPEQTAQTCTHEQFVKIKGCVKDLYREPGGIQRVILDRTSPLYHALYHQRTCCERVNTLARERGIERPRVCNARSLANLNTLTYGIVNGQVLVKAKSINARLLPTPKGVLQMN